MYGGDPHGTFHRLGPAVPRIPVVLAVPHAGRDYPEAMLARASASRERLEALEDRHVDALIAGAVLLGATAFVATRARCWMDLNRDEREVDPAMVDPMPPGHRLLNSAKLRGGLGLIPRRVAGIGELWRGPLPADEVQSRILAHHRPYHGAIAAALAAARTRFGAVLLLDCHSMPPVSDDPGMAPQVVIGDRYGRSAAPALVKQLVGLVEDAGLVVSRNTPYAGGYTLDRHGRPRAGIHAVQVEIDRTLYLEPDRRTLSAGAAPIAALLARMTGALAEELGGEPPAIAAE